MKSNLFVFSELFVTFMGCEDFFSGKNFLGSDFSRFDF